MELWDRLNTSLSRRSLRSRGTLRLVIYGAVAIFATWTLYSSLTVREGLATMNDEIPQRPIKNVKDWAPKPVPTTWLEKADVIKDAFQFAYNGWEQYAAPADELRPNSERKYNNLNGWGLTMFDSLDTIILMGLDDELERAIPMVKHATFEMIDYKEQAPFFETVIRYLGGLLSAYAMTNNTIFLQKADLLGSGLAPAFRTPTGYPAYSVSTITGVIAENELMSLAEVASCQMEYMYLAKITGERKYYDIADRILKNIAEVNVFATGGMLPNTVDIITGHSVGSKLSAGAAADSAHEYLLKYYLLTGRKDRVMLEMYLRFTMQVITELLYVSPVRGILYVTDVKGKPREPTHTFEHLTTFVAGLFALGAELLPLDDLSSLGVNLDTLSAGLPDNTIATYTELKHHRLSDIHQWIAEGVAHASWLTYADMRTGLGPDEVVMHTYAKDSQYMRPSMKAELWIKKLEAWRVAGSEGKPPGLSETLPRVMSDEDRGKGVTFETTRDYDIQKNEYLLRPETVESFFIMWKTTGDVKWRERGWAIFQAIDRECRTAVGYTAVRHVDHSSAEKKDDMPSYFLAETLKYLYLLFIDEDKLPLDRWVFNTEAHPLPVFNWTDGERSRFNIP